VVSYSRIVIVGNDAPVKLKKFKVRHGARLILLRRTLRARPLLASLVTHLHVPDPIIPLYSSNGHPNPEYDEYVCLLASLVMCCPSLETFTGFHPFYNHTFDRLTHALSTRTKLKQHVWVIAENDEVSERAQKQLPPGLLDDHQVYQFQQYHLRWPNLNTLMLCSPGSLGVLEHDCLVDVLHSLPSLKNLCVSSFDADDFNDFTLLQLPRIISLRLEECEGVSDAGLAKWAASPASVFVERLTLIHQNITSLITISKVLSGLDRLKKFSIIQSDLAPSIPLDMVVFQPLFASRTLEWIHWDIGEEKPGGVGSEDHQVDINELENHEGIPPNTHLALSILHHGFPALRFLRAPRDTFPPGVLQSVCRPARNANVLLAEDRYSLHTLFASPKSNSLQVARIRAQQLIDKALVAKREFMKVVVTDHSPEREIGERLSTTSSSKSSGGLSNLTTSTALTEPVFDVPPTVLWRSPPDKRYLLGEDWDKEVVCVDRAASTPTASTTDESLPAAVDKADRVLLHRDASASPEEDQDNRPSPPTPPSKPPGPLPVIPPRSPLRSTPAATAYATTSPLKIHEFSLPTFVGRISIHISDKGQVFQPPRLHLLPDITGRDGNGGIASWGELLRVGERVKKTRKKEVGEEEGWIRDGCVGNWNRRSGNGDGKGEGNGKEWWRHTERERVRDGWEVGIENFF
jgi:hypothetical protein